MRRLQRLEETWAWDVWGFAVEDLKLSHRDVDIVPRNFGFAGFSKWVGYESKYYSIPFSQGVEADTDRLVPGMS